MIVAWFAIISAVVGVCAVYGGRKCEVPESGPFHRLLAGRKFVPTNHRRSAGCLEVRSDGTASALTVHHRN
jgi:hypothetical protein